MAQTVKITPSLGKLEFIGNISLAASTSAIFTGNTSGSISLIFPASQGISITGSLTVTGSAKFSSILDSANATGTLNYVIAANGSGGYTWTDLNTIFGAVYVPLTRTITIDGVSQDLSANRTWNILPTAGSAGQILAKNSNTNYDVTWIDNYTSTVKHLVKLSAPMTAGTPVYVSGTTGQSGTNMIVSKSTNSTEMGSSKTMGLLETGGGTNAIVYVITEGLLAGINTSTAAAGDPVWLGPNGTLIYGLVNKPVSPSHLVYLGVVTRVQQNNGEIFVKVQNGFELGELHDVLINGVSTGQLLRRDTDGLWKNWTPNFLTAEADTLNTVLARGNTTQYAITINNSTDSTSPGTGALVVAGGAGFGGNVYIDGNLVIGGTTTTVSAQNLKVADNMIYLNDGIDAVVNQASGNGSQIIYTTQDPHGYTPGMDVTVYGLSPEEFNISNVEILEVTQNTFTVAGLAIGDILAEGFAIGRSESNPDIGLAAGYHDDSYKHTGFFRDASDGVWKVYDGYTPEPDASPFIDTSDPSFTYAPLRAAQITGTSFVKVGGTSSQFLKADGSVDSTTYLTSENDPYRVTAVTVTGTATKTITITRADSTTVTTTWTDYDTDTNTYVTSAGFNIGSGVLTLTRNDAGTVTVDLDGRYSEIGHTHTVSTGTGGYIAVAGGEANIFSIDSRDRRALVDLPSTFDRGLYLDFKNPQIFPELTAGGYKGQMIWRAYGDDGDMSGGYPMQIVYDQEGNIHYRLGISGNAWLDTFSTIASRQWVEGNGYITSESDPTVPSHVKSITTTNISNWNAAYNDKINSAAFNTGSGLLTLTQQDGGTVTVNLDGRYLTSASDSQTLEWIPETLTLQISNGNQVELTGLATEIWVANQGYITGYSETDTLDSVTDRGATTTNTIRIGKLGIGRGASANESISVENPEGTWLIQGFRNSVSIGGLHTNSGILHLQAQASAEIRFETAGNVTWGGAVIATRNWVGSQGYLTAEADTLASVTARGASTAEAVNFTSTQLTMSPHYYTNMYGETETYVHFYPSGGNGPQISAVNWRVWNGENGAMVLRAAGDGSLTWDGNEIATRSWTQAQGYLTSVSDVWVNTTGDTMTGALTINTTGIAGAAALRINNSSSSTFVHTQENFAPNLTSGQHNILVVGKSGSTKNAGYVGYYWEGAGSNSNFVTLGHWGSDDLLRIYGNGETHIYGNTVLLNAGQLYINNSNPTIYLQDSDQRSAMIHVNSGYFYVLNGSGNNSTTWAQQINGRWAMSINLTDNYTTFGGVGDFPTEVYAGGSFRAPIFYDSANTNYYLDPNSQSVLYNVQVSNVLRIGPNYHVQQNANGDLEFKYI